MPRLISALEQLSDAAQVQVLSWLELYPASTVVQMIAKPEPEGFGLQTHITSLRRFHARRQASSRPDEIEIARLFLPDEVTEPIEKATNSILKDWAFQIATNPQRTNGGFKALSRWALKMREHTQRELQLKLNGERLALEREKFEFNAARQALLHHEQIGRILKDRKSDDEQKINAAREHLFGRPVPPMQSTNPEFTADTFDR